MDNKYIFRWALGQVALRIEQQGFVIPAAASVACRQHGIEIPTAGFGRGRQHTRMKFYPLGEADAHAVFLPLVSEERVPWPDQDRDINGTTLGAYARTAAAVIANRPDIT